jgi:hypothetical protein
LPTAKPEEEENTEKKESDFVFTHTFILGINASIPIMSHTSISMAKSGLRKNISINTTYGRGLKYAASVNRKTHKK